MPKSKAEVVAAIKKLKKNKFPGVDKNSADEIVLQVAGQSDVDAIYRLCNKIWETENVGWLSLYQFTKMTNCAVTTIYRGISILLHCELFATVIMQRIRNRTEELIKEARAGFRPNRSTIDHRDVYRSCMVEFGKTLYACYVDFQKAFGDLDYVGS